MAKEEEAKVLKDRIKVAIETYVQTEHFNETLKRECPADSYCFFENILENPIALQETVMQSFSSMILRYKIQDKVYYGGSVDWNARHNDTDVGTCFGIQPNYIGSSVFAKLSPSSS